MLRDVIGVISPGAAVSSPSVIGNILRPFGVIARLEMMMDLDLSLCGRFADWCIFSLCGLGVSEHPTKRANRVMVERTTAGLMIDLFAAGSAGAGGLVVFGRHGVFLNVRPLNRRGLSWRYLTKKG